MSKLHALIQNYYGGDEGLNEILKEAMLLDKTCENLENGLELACIFIGEMHGQCKEEEASYWIDKGIEIEKEWIRSGKAP